MENRLSGHSVYRTQYHVVWTTKYRRKILNPGVRRCLEYQLKRVLRGLAGVEIIEQNIQPEHIHMVIIIPPKYAVSDVIGEIKGRTSSNLRKQFQWLSKAYFKENVVWSPGYFVSTVGLDEKTIMNYVKYQEHQDSGQAKLDL